MLISIPEVKILSCEWYCCKEWCYFQKRNWKHFIRSKSTCKKMENKSIDDENKLEIDGLSISIKHKDKLLSMKGILVMLQFPWITVLPHQCYQYYTPLCFRLKYVDWPKITNQWVSVLKRFGNMLSFYNVLESLIWFIVNLECIGELHTISGSSYISWCYPMLSIFYI